MFLFMFFLCVICVSVCVQWFDLVPIIFSHISAASRFNLFTVYQDTSPSIMAPIYKIRFLTTPSFNLLEIEIVPNEAGGVPVEK